MVTNLQGLFFSTLH